jgi:hypothetical protein
MAKEFLTPPDFKAGLLLNGSAGTTGQQITSQGPGQPPVWGAPGSGSSFGGYAVGNYIVPTTGALGTGTTVGANQIGLMPFMVERAITASELVVRVTTAAAGADFQLAVYGSVNGLFSGIPIVSTAIALALPDSFRLR